MVDDSIDESLVSLPRRLAIIDHVTVEGERILVAHEPLALFIEVPMHGAHAREVSWSAHERLIMELFADLLDKDALENVLDVLALADFVEQGADVLSGRFPFHLILQVSQSAITLLDLRFVEDGLFTELLSELVVRQIHVVLRLGVGQLRR